MNKPLLKTLAFATAVSFAGFASAASPFQSFKQSFNPSFKQPINPVRYQSESDLIVQDNIEAALAANRDLDGSLLNVSVLEGRVAVTGSLDDPTQAANVTRIARTVEGVRSVTTFLVSELG